MQLICDLNALAFSIDINCFLGSFEKIVSYALTLSLNIIWSSVNFTRVCIASRHRIVYQVPVFCPSLWPAGWLPNGWCYHWAPASFPRSANEELMIVQLYKVIRSDGKGSLVYSHHVYDTSQDRLSCSVQIPCNWRLHRPFFRLRAAEFWLVDGWCLGRSCRPIGNSACTLDRTMSNDPELMWNTSMRQSLFA